MKSRMIIGAILLVFTTALAIQSYILLGRVKAVEAAIAYKPESYIICPRGQTAATHLATGAKHVFSNGCLAPGWKADK